MLDRAMMVVGKFGNVMNEGHKAWMRDKNGKTRTIFYSSVEVLRREALFGIQYCQWRHAETELNLQLGRGTGQLRLSGSRYVSHFFIDINA